MSFQPAFVFAFGLTFLRASAMLLTAPFFSTTPLQVRLGLTAVLSAAIAPVVQGEIGPVPASLYDLLMAGLVSLGIGLLLGLALQLVMLAAQMAGSFLDLQIGLASAQLFNPMTGGQTSILAQFKYLLAIVVLLLTDGHHVMFRAFMASYQLNVHFDSAGASGLIQLLGSSCVLALQIAAPVAAVTVIVDAAAGLVNKAVPQMQVFFVSMPAKIAASLVVLSLCLPVLVSGVQGSVERTYLVLFEHFSR